GPRELSETTSVPTRRSSDLRIPGGDPAAPVQHQQFVAGWHLEGAYRHPSGELLVPRGPHRDRAAGESEAHMVALLGDRVRLLEQVLRGPLELRDVRAVDHVDDGGLAEVRAQHLQVVQGSAPVFADRSPGGLTERDAGVPLERRTEADRGIRGAADEQS